MEGVENATGLKVGEAVRRAEAEKERLQQERQPRQAVEVETVGYVVEQKPVAEIVVPVAPSPGREKVRRMV